MPSPLVERLKNELDASLGGAEFRRSKSAPQSLLEEGVANFRASGAALLDQATPYLWEYYRETLSAYEGQDLSEYGIPVIGDSEDIWTYVSFENSPEVAAGEGPYEPDATYLSFSGDVAWEPEHGLQLVYAHGLKVCKVGPFDGHNTNAHAYGDLSKLGVVFA